MKRTYVIFETVPKYDPRPIMRLYRRRDVERRMAQRASDYRDDGYETYGSAREGRIVVRWPDPSTRPHDLGVVISWGCIEEKGASE